MNDDKEIRFLKAFLPIGFFFCLLIYGLFVHPVIMGGSMLPLEIIILLALSFSILYLFKHGYNWNTIEKHIVKKVGEAIPIVLILFAIGVLIGSWIISGTIPMLIYYGISMINPSWIYIFSFLICIIFSLLTGTSWGSAGTIGVVMMGISQVYGADLAISAGAIVGGSFFGDKLSPLSDTTNIASLATDVKLFDHIHSMLFTTGPAAVIAGIIYIFLSPSINATTGVEELSSIKTTLIELEQLFNFNIILLLPLLVVIYGSVTKRPIFITLLSSAWVAMILALIFQSFSLEEVFTGFKSGFNVSMSDIELSKDSKVLNILNRGGLYNLIEGIVVSLLVFAFIGTLDVLNAIEVSIRKLMSMISKPYQLVVACLSATWVTNLTTSNQYATSFIIGTAFKDKFDKMRVDRKVLSRSIEDAGTMMENLAPWTPSGIFMSLTLGVGALEYAPYQFMSLCNIVIAYVFAFTGIAIFKSRKSTDEEESRNHT